MQGIASASSSRHLRALWRGRAGQRIAAAGLPGDGDERQLFIPAACGSRHHPYCIACRPEGGGRRRRRGQAYLSTANREAGDAAAGRTDGRPEEADADPPSCGTGQQATLAKNVAELSKARLSALVVSTTAFGFLAAARVPRPSPPRPSPPSPPRPSARPSAPRRPRRSTRSSSPTGTAG
mmetsp:Transcript_12799/g.29205  ORF Transcript_12799/g.29205 Transcript_12799/m.29205 type:complete len:180 (+) Transcript_12799:26-565(+)